MNNYLMFCSKFDCQTDVLKENVTQSCYLTCEAAGTTAGELVDLVHTHTFIQTGGGDTLVHLRLTQRA